MRELVAPLSLHRHSCFVGFRCRTTFSVVGKNAVRRSAEGNWVQCTLLLACTVTSTRAQVRAATAATLSCKMLVLANVALHLDRRVAPAARGMRHTKHPMEPARAHGV
jgi:hypothetical protein